MNLENHLNRRKFLRRSVEVAGGAAAALYVPSFLVEPRPAHAAAVTTPNQEPDSQPTKPKILLGANLFDGAFSPTLEKDLDGLKDNGMSSVRVIVAQKDYSDIKAARQFSHFLNEADKRKLKVAGIFINRWLDQGHHPQGLDVGSYSQGINQTPELGLQFYATAGYDQNPFTDFVETMVSTNKGRGVRWVIGNELRFDSTYMVRFFSTMTNLVKRLDPDSKVSSGVLNMQNAMMNSGLTGEITPAQLYASVPDLDPSFNDYNNAKKQECLEDVQLAATYHREVHMDELGYNYLPTKNRVPLFEEAIDFWIKQGVTSISLWGFVPPHKLPDKDLGITKKNDDYDGIVRLIQSRGLRNAA